MSFLKLTIISAFLLFSNFTMAQLCGDGPTINPFPFELLQKKLTAYTPSVTHQNEISEFQSNFQVQEKSDFLDITVFVFKYSPHNKIATGHIHTPKKVQELHFELNSTDPKITSLVLDGKDGSCGDLFKPLPHIGARLYHKETDFYLYLGLFPLVF